MFGILKKFPLLSSILRVKSRSNTPFISSEEYWIKRYEMGGDSGKGSYNNFALFKAEVINNFILSENINTVIEFGCGDGNQLIYANYPNYIGFDISPSAILLCKQKFKYDTSKKFKMMVDYNNEIADLSLSLDVIYHLIEDSVFSEYMSMLFDSSNRFVIIYSSNTNKNLKSQSPHVKHREFSQWISNHKPKWKLLKYIPNKFPYQENNNKGSFSDFYIYRKNI